MLSLDSYLSRYNKTCFTTIVSIYLLIMVGGVVRASGSGMGCPDWPKCFGMWVPPTDESQLPPDYKLKYAHLSYANQDFNVYKTWTEYVNRLIGVLIGIFVFVNFLASLPLRKRFLRITLLSLFSFILVAFQGWVGAKVVSSNLKPYMITIHMIIALVLVFILIYLYVSTSKNSTHVQSKKLEFPLILGITLSFVQIILGTRVRESVDELLHSGVSHHQLIDHLSLSFYVHRSFSLLLIGVIFFIIYKLIQLNGVTFATALLAIALAVELLAGVLLNYFDFPVFMQPVHLLFGSIIIGVLFYLYAMNKKTALQTI